MADVRQVDQTDIKSLWEDLKHLSGKTLYEHVKYMVANVMAAHIRTRILY